jgi:pantetheine-phosphate adenylyltransferase
VSSSKTPCLNIQQRLDLLSRCTKQYGNVQVDHCEGLVVEFAKRVGANVLIRGLRGIGDLDSESHMAAINRKLALFLLI